jgi:hypothetical protein
MGVPSSANRVIPNSLPTLPPVSGVFSPRSITHLGTVLLDPLIVEVPPVVLFRTRNPLVLSGPTVSVLMVV